MNEKFCTVVLDLDCTFLYTVTSDQDCTTVCTVVNGRDCTLYVVLPMDKVDLGNIANGEDCAMSCWPGLQLAGNVLLRIAMIALLVLNIAGLNNGLYRTAFCC